MFNQGKIDTWAVNQLDIDLIIENNEELKEYIDEYIDEVIKELIDQFI